MPFAIEPTEPAPKSQYASDSAPNQSYNCGPTTVVNAVAYHRDTVYGIEDTRNLATSRNYTGTSTSERKVMLDRRGVPSSVRHLSVAEVKGLLNGRRAFDMALLMGRIPFSIRVRPFAGAHSVEGIAKGYATCPVHRVKEPGIWVNNPDFHPERGERARYFYPDHAWIPAYLALGGWCVVPNADKATRVAYRKRCRTAGSVNLRSGPSTRHTIVKTVGSGLVFTSIQLERAGGTYSVVARSTRRDWLSFNFNGRLVWVARGYVREV